MGSSVSPTGHQFCTLRSAQAASNTFLVKALPGSGPHRVQTLSPGSSLPPTFLVPCAPGVTGGLFVCFVLLLFEKRLTDRRVQRIRKKCTCIKIPGMDNH